MSEVYGQPALPDKKRVDLLQDIAHKMRLHIINMTDAAGSGHPTSSSSAADILSVLFFHVMHYSVEEPKHGSSDRFVLSKGHACPVLYAAWCEAGLLSKEHILTLRKPDSLLEGHPTPRQNYIDVATGSLGQGLSIAAGMAYCGKYFDKASYRVFCMMGDGETAEGSVWEAAAFSSHYKLDNLVAIVDVNRLGQSEATALGHRVEVYKARFDGFGWNAIIVDGHDIMAVCKAFMAAATTKDKPTVLIAKTLKGKYFPGVEDLDNWHGKPLGKQSVASLEAVKALIKDIGPHGLTPRPIKYDAPKIVFPTVKLNEPPNYKMGEKIATRKTYGEALVKLGENYPRIVALDGDTKNSTFAITYKKRFSDRFVECFIAEQNMVGVGIGFGCRDRNIVFVSAFAAFFTRAFDQIRMGAISQTEVNFVGSHAGCSIGEDGPSQMALEDFAMFRTIPGAVCFYPSDAVSAERAIELAANHRGVTFTRTSRPATAVVYENTETFEIGKSKVLRKSDSDKVTVVGAGVTLHEALAAYETLKAKGTHIRVVDAFCLKPIDKQLMVECGKATGGRIVTVEDHYFEGGLGEGVAAAVAEDGGVKVHRLAVTGIPRSGPAAVLMEDYGISASCIVKAVEAML